MPKFRKKPIEIEAEQFTNENKDRALNFVRCNVATGFDEKNNPVMDIQTLEGTMRVSLGDWIIKGVNGEFYPCKPDIFEKTYEPIET